MTPKESRDLRQLSELFKDLVSIARSHTSQELDGAAAEWLKGARISIMKHLEESPLLGYRFLNATLPVHTTPPTNAGLL
ncbi:hypothetical protein H0H93_000465 [Arthromyces matolae]|nr:hypothetical protein H0H93_000465 [Arthromyces matolae]